MRALCCGLLLLGALAHAQPDLELDDAKKFLAGRPELQALVSKAADKEGTGVYRLKLDGKVPATWLVKQGSAWVTVMSADPKRLEGLLPANVLGSASVKTLFVVVGASGGTLSAKGLAGELQKVVGAFGRDVSFTPGVTLFAQLEAGTDGTLGQLRNAGLLPQGPLWLTGSTGEALASALLEASPPSLSALDLSLTLGVPSMVPAPFTLLTSPKLTLGDTQLTFTRKGGAFTLSGQQLKSTLALGERTFTLPKTTLTFAASGDGYDVTVEGRSADKPWRDAFGLRGVELQSVSLRGTITSTKTEPGKRPIKGFSLGLGAKLSIERTLYEGEFFVDVDNGALKEFTLALQGDLNLKFIPGAADFTLKQFSVSITPGTQQAALAGQLAWKDLEGSAALVLAKEAMLFMRFKNLDLVKLAAAGGPTPAGLPSLPPLDVLLTLGSAANSGEVSNLPGAAQTLIDEVSGTTGGKVKVVNGLTLVTRIDAERIGATSYGVKGPVLLAGSLDGRSGAFRIATSLPSMPSIKGLPKGFGVEAPEVFVAVSQKGGSTVGSFGLGLRLLMPVDKQVLAFRGSMAGSSAGTFAFTGALETNWVDPIGLAGITVVAPAMVTIGVGADGSVDLGLQAGASIAKRSYSPMAMCLNLQAAAPAPVPKKLALRFKGDEFGPQAQMDVMEALVKSVANGPLKGSLTDPVSTRALAQVGPGVDRISDSVDALNLPLLSFNQVDVALTTPGVTCELPAIEGLGMKVQGTARFMGRELGSVDSAVTLAGGLAIRAKAADLNFLDLVRLSNARLEALAPMPGAPPDASSTRRMQQAKTRLEETQKALKAVKKKLGKTKDEDDKADLADEKADLEEELAELEKAASPGPGQFTLSGRAEVLRAKGELLIAIDKSGAEFEVASSLADLGALTLEAQTVGDDLTKVKDFQLALAVSGEAEGQLQKKLAAALKASAQARKQAQASLGKDADKAQKDAQAEFDRLDDKVGKDFRKAKKDLKKAKKKLKKAKRAISKAKKKCEKDLGPAAKLCDTLDAAKAGLSAAKGTLSASQKALKGIEKSADYGRLQAARGTLAALKAGKAAAEAGLAGWGAVDKAAQLALDGSDLISVDEVELEGSLKEKRGTLSVTVSVGDAELDQDLEVSLASAQPLDLSELAEKVADEISRQATKEGSDVWNALRKGKK